METCLDPILYLEDTLSKEMNHILAENCSRFCRLQVKRKPNQDGDVHVSGFTRNLVSTNKADNCQQVVQQFKSSSQLNKYIIDLNVSSNGQLNLCLNKVVIMASVIRNVMNKGDEYGLFMDSDNTLGLTMDQADTKYVLNANNGDSSLTSLDCLRVLVTTNHLHRLLCANRVPVSTALSVVQDSIPQSTMDTLALFNNHITTTSHFDYLETNKTIEKSLIDCQFVYSTDASKSECLQSGDSSKDMCFDCQKYRKNTSISPIPITNCLIQKLSKLELALDNCEESYMIHMTSQRKLHSSKQCGLVWEALSTHSCAQIYLTLGDIAVHDKQKQQQQHSSVEELLRLRESHVRSAYLLKYGDIVKGQGWDDSIRSFSVATLKLQILSVSQNHQVMFDVSKEAQDFRPYTFILYNCARLSKLFHHYQEAVQQGLYPPLPDIEEIDFSLLREKDEWNLVLRYVTVYPSIVRGSLNDILASTKHESLMRVNVNKICCFLLDLSQDFSSYYGRTHVLGEPRPHLFPTMFARLYLLKAIKQVFHNCLDLLDVQALSQM